jgi:hypothetical protein
MAIRITGLDQTIKALSAKGTKAVQAIADELEDTAKKIEINAAQDAPSYVPQMPDLKLNINQRVRSEPKKFFKGEAISWEIFVQTNPDNRMDDFDGYMEFNTGQAYVLITDQSDTEVIGNRCSPRQTVNLTIDIVTKFPMGASGKLASENIASSIRPMVTKPIIAMPSEWLIVDIKSFSQSIIEQGTTQVAYRKLLRYSFDIWQVV